MVDPQTWIPRKAIVHGREYSVMGVYGKKSRVGRFCSSFKCCFCGKESAFALRWAPKAHPTQIHHDTYTIEGRMMTVDHIIPKSWGGIMVSMNLRPACNKCNSRRANKVTLEELESLKGNLQKVVTDWDLFISKVKEAYPEYDLTTLVDSYTNVTRNPICKMLPFPLKSIGSVIMSHYTLVMGRLFTSPLPTLARLLMP